LTSNLAGDRLLKLRVLVQNISAAHVSVNWDRLNLVCCDSALELTSSAAAGSNWFPADGELLGPVNVVLADSLTPCTPVKEEVKSHSALVKRMAKHGIRIPSCPGADPNDLALFDGVVAEATFLLPKQYVTEEDALAFCHAVLLPVQVTDREPDLATITSATTVFVGMTLDRQVSTATNKRAVLRSCSMQQLDRGASFIAQADVCA
jgi:hypothetical protein